MLDRIVLSHYSHADTFMVIDGDKTLTPQDTGRLFYEMMAA